ncbi:MAG: GFA family protein [Bdellovibrionales bacterium]
MTSPKTDLLIESACHCGELKLKIHAAPPEALTSCNCSICRRYGTLWSYYSPTKVEVIANPGAIQEYSWGEKELAFGRCANCGCVSYWRGLNPTADRMGINSRLFTNVDISKIRIRLFDGADTWKFLD